MIEFQKKLIKWFVNSRTFFLPRRILSQAIQYALSIKKREIISYDTPEKSKIIDLIHKIKKETELVLNDFEAYQLFVIAKAMRKINGDMAEVGVFKGGSAKLICEAKEEKVLHLFDTFEGIPKVDPIHDSSFYRGQFAASLEEVKEYLKEYKNIYFYKGIFPATAESLKDKKFSFVHLDVDTFESTLNCLEFFYQRMSLGGGILSHDYQTAKGVKKPSTNFLKINQS